MLVLTRKPNQAEESVIKIGDDIEICLVDVRGDQIKLGITAPDNVAMWRRELWDANQGETQQQNI